MIILGESDFIYKHILGYKSRTQTNKQNKGKSVQEESF